MWSTFFFQAEDGIRDLVRSRGLGDVYKRQVHEAVVIGIARRLDPADRALQVRPDAFDEAQVALSLIHI